MSGIAAGFGKPVKKDIEKMFEKIAHRGNYLSGIVHNNKTIMAQNYLKADAGNAEKDFKPPVGSSQNQNLMICYDGQIGNLTQLAMDFNIPSGPFKEERLLLTLYQKLGRDMFRYLDDAIFSFIISDGENIFAARDLLGIKTLFYGRKDDTIYFSSELKSIVEVADQVYEFPAGHWMDKNRKFVRFADLPEKPPQEQKTDLNQIVEDIRNIIEQSIRNRVHLDEHTGALLSGGMDSSVIAYLGSMLYKEKFGKDARLKTYAIGVGESGDIKNARIISNHIGSDHHELLVNLDQILEVIPEVIYYLESFDPSLVRSSISNFLISKYAKDQGIEELLSGEGGDEIFCGYTYLKRFPLQEMFSRQMECLRFLHNNASLRLDRMNQCHSVRVVAPLISGRLLSYTMSIPPEYKQKPEQNKKIEKWIFRKAYEPFLPSAITERIKQEFSQGSGSAAVLPNHFEKQIDDQQFAEAQKKFPMVRSKEELYYFNLFTKYFGTTSAVKTVGQWITL
ncbi:MAG: asparagine synthase-related protein [Spirochaetota bacterium]